VSQKSRLSLKVRHLEKKKVISTSTVTPEMLEPQMGKTLKIYLNEINFVAVFGCCVTSQAHQNGCLAIQ
jgi:hypothetical protein